MIPACLAVVRPTLLPQIKQKLAYAHVKVNRWGWRLSAPLSRKIAASTQTSCGCRKRPQINLMVSNAFNAKCKSSVNPGAESR